MEQETYRTNKVFLSFYDYAKHSDVRLSINHKSNCAAFSKYTRITDWMLLTAEISKSDTSPHQYERSFRRL
jgi:hypothetical protein